MIAMDIDGTLMADDRTISDYSIGVLRKAADKGYLIVLATGRTYDGLPTELAQLHCPYLLINSGAVVLEQSSGKEIYHAGIARDKLRQCISVIRRHDVIGNFATKRSAYMQEQQIEAIADYAPRDSFWTTTFKKRQIPFREFDELTGSESEPILKLNLYFRSEEERSTTRSELAEIPGLDICSSISGNLEITSRDATKGKALMALAEYLHLLPEEIMAFGDSDNDLTMMKAAGIGVAMANAIPQTRAAADRITRSNNEDGVAWAIEQWLLT
jgi:hypothetical protein